MKKLSKRQAKSLFNKGRIIYLKTSKLSVQVMEHSPWFHWFKIKKDLDFPDFEKLVNEFAYYNCNEEVGLRVNYYAYP